MYDYKIWPGNYIDNALSATLTFVAIAQLSHPAVFKYTCCYKPLKWLTDVKRLTIKSYLQVVYIT